jgi:prohibitin 2
MTPRLVGLAILALVVLAGVFGCYYVIDPGWRGVKVTLGKMSENFLAPGPGLKAPFITEIRQVNVQQDTQEISAECFSSDLQQINIRLKVLYRIPESSIVSVLRDYAGEPFDKLILPRVQEAVKEVTAMKSAADIVKTREQIKVAALARLDHVRRPDQRGQRDDGQDPEADGSQRHVTPLSHQTYPEFGPATLPRTVFSRAHPG